MDRIEPRAPPRWGRPPTGSAIRPRCGHARTLQALRPAGAGDSCRMRQKLTCRSNSIRLPDFW